MVNRHAPGYLITKLVCNNSPSFNWTLAFREQVYAEWQSAGKDVWPIPTRQHTRGLMDVSDDSELAAEADKLVQSFQADAAREAGIFHHLITLPTYHETALGVIFCRKAISAIWVCWPMSGYSASGNSPRSGFGETRIWPVRILATITRNISPETMLCWLRAKTTQ